MYKRQEEAEPLCRRFADACGKVGLKPVLEPACGGSDASFLSAHGIRCLVLATGMHEIHSVREYTTPVSYTHLDVYKRQALR